MPRSRPPRPPPHAAHHRSYETARAHPIAARLLPCRQQEPCQLQACCCRPGSRGSLLRTPNGWRQSQQMQQLQHRRPQQRLCRCESAQNGGSCATKWAVPPAGPVVAFWRGQKASPRVPKKGQGQLSSPRPATHWHAPRPGMCWRCAPQHAPGLPQLDQCAGQTLQRATSRALHCSPIGGS